MTGDVMPGRAERRDVPEVPGVPAAETSTVAGRAAEDVARPLPRREGLAGEYYAWIARGELRFQRCRACGRWRHLPRPICPDCHSRDWSWERSSGTGRVYTWTVTYRPLHPAFTDVPYAQVLIEMDEGPRVLSWVVDVDPEDLTFGMPVEVEFMEVGGTTLPVFQRAEGS